MRDLIQSSAYKKDIKRELKGQHRKTIEGDLGPIVTALCEDIRLPKKNRDHALTGDLKGLRDCHVYPDLVLIYEKVGGVDDELHLARLGSHSELGL